MNLQSEQTNKFTKGFLYTINTQENKCIGYLFGTIHKLDSSRLGRMHPIMHGCFDRSSHLFLEINDDLSQKDIEHPRGVDDLLYKMARAQGKNIYGLETELSRKVISDKINADSDTAYFKLKLTGILVLCFNSLASNYNILINSANTIAVSQDLSNSADLVDKSSKIERLLSITQDITGLMPLITYIIDNQKFFPRELDDNFIQILDGINVWVNIFDKSVECENVLKERFVAQRRSDENDIFSRGNEASINEASIIERYVNGDCSDNEFSMLKDTSDLQLDFISYQESLRIKQIQERDLVMAESIHVDLLETVASDGNRCGFYAPGAFHVRGNYDNSLPKLLQKKGWLLNKVELPSVVEISQNRFFSHLNYKLPKLDNEVMNAHDNLLKQLEPYRSETTKAVFNSLDKQQYGQAIRRICTVNNVTANAMLQIILTFKDAFSIDINEQVGEKLQTAMHYAAINGNSYGYNLLLQAGGRVDLINYEGKAAKDYLVHDVSTSEVPMKGF